MTDTDNASRPATTPAVVAPLSPATAAGSAGVFPRLKAIASSTLCDMAGCGREWTARVVEGTSLLNPGKDVRLCDYDYSLWMTEETKRRAEFSPGRQVPHKSKRTL